MLILPNRQTRTPFHTEKQNDTQKQYYKKQEEKLPSEALRTCERRRVMVADNAQRWLSIIFNNDTIAK